MIRKPMVERRLLRLYIFLSLAWAGLWVTGIVAVSTVAVRQSARALQQDFDAELALVATATYGLAFFDHQGRFDDSLFHNEPDLSSSPFDIWVVEPGKNPKIHLAPRKPHFRIKNLSQLAFTVVETQLDVFDGDLDGQGRTYRVHAKATYDEDEYDVARAAIIVIGDPQSVVLSQQEFARKILMVGIIIGLLGLVVGIGLAYWGLRPVAVSLQARERFLALIAHELRSPVAALRSVTDSALAGDEDAALALVRMSPLVDQTGRVVDDLLLFARLDTSDPAMECENFRLDLLAEACVPEGSSIQLDARQSVVHGDPRLIRVLIRNLVENAVRHSGQPEKSVCLTIRDGEIIVQDDGPGFPGHVLVAAVGFSAVPSERGTGLGLAICRLIAKLHAGELTLENTANGGACAKFHFSSQDIS